MKTAKYYNYNLIVDDNQGSRASVAGRADNLTQAIKAMEMSLVNMIRNEGVEPNTIVMVIGVRT